MKKISLSFCVAIVVFSMSGCNFLGDEKPNPPPAESAAPAPVAVAAASWDKVTAQAPKQAPNLTLWLRADGKVKTKAGGLVVGWTDESKNKIKLTSDPAVKGPILVQDGMNAKPSIRFTGAGDRLASEVVLGSKLIKNDQATLVIVMRPDSKHPNNDTFGWGDCGPNRFNTHFASNRMLLVQVGDPSRPQLSAAQPPGWDNEAHVVTFIRRGTDISLSVDGQQISGMSEFKTSVKTDVSSSIVVAGACGNFFQGLISEILVYNQGLDKDAQQGVEKYLSEKYRITLK